MMLTDAGVVCELREVRLSDKPVTLLDASPKGTVPVLCLPDGRVLEESLDIMFWAAQQGEGELWWPHEQAMREAMRMLIQQNDEVFKYHLDRYKYPQRFDIRDITPHWEQGQRFLAQLEARLQHAPFLFGARASLADVAVFPFVRQFAAVDHERFRALPCMHVQRWLQGWLACHLFETCMHRHAVWQAGDVPVYLF